MHSPYLLDFLFSNKTLMMMMMMTKADGKLGNSLDKMASAADMFTMGLECQNLLVTLELSTYVRLAGALGNVRIYPLRMWGPDLALAAPLESTEPTGDFWYPTDHCHLRDMQCPRTA